MLLLLLAACTSPPPHGDTGPGADTDPGADAGDTDTACVPTAEVCNAADDDCDGLVDEEPTDGLTLHGDADADGFGDPATATLACPGDGIADGTDCDDTDDTVFPGADDTRWDDIDQDCDGADRDCADAGPVHAGDLRLEDGDLAAFCASYGSIDGDLTLRVDAVDLGGLECLCEVTGRLNVASSPALASFHGLDAPARVGTLTVRGNASLATVAGLEQLRSVDQVEFSDNPVLVDLSALGGVRGELAYLDFWTNASLPDLHGLEGITAVGDGEEGSIDLMDLPSLTSLDGLDGLRTVGRLNIRDADALVDLEGLAGLEHAWGVSLDAAGLVDLSGLRNLRSVEELAISNTTSLTTLGGLASLARIGEEIRLSDNAALSDIAVLAAADTEIYRLTLSGNPAIPDLLPFSAVESVEFLGLGDNNLTTLAGLEALDSLGYLTLAEPALVDIGALGSAGGSITVVEISGTRLTSLAGLENVNGIEHLTLLDNTALADLTALASVELTYVEIARAPALTDLAGLSDFADDGSLWVYQNDALTTLDGLLPARDMWGVGVSLNPVLTDISAVSGRRRLDWLIVTDNPMLATADADAICAEYALAPEVCSVSGNGP